tara:strand:- start:12991 stop:13146 length:156 start_codon:yes stop_codon:yes gene_type:complete
VEGPINRFSSVKEAVKKLKEIRDIEILEKRNPYVFVLLPIDGKIGFLPPNS